MTLYGSLIVYSTEAFSEHYCQTRASLIYKAIHINGNVYYESILKHRKYRCDSFVSFLFTVNRDEDIACESFDSKSFNVLRDIIIYQLRCYDFYLMWSS